MLIATKLPESLTSSSFKIELPYSITMPHNAIFTVDEICIPHAWYSIEKDINDKLYLYEMDMTSRERASRIIQIPPGNFNCDLLKSTLQSLRTPAVAFSSFNVSYDPNTFSITIQIAGNPAVVFFLFYLIKKSTAYIMFFGISAQLNWIKLILHP